MNQVTQLEKTVENLSRLFEANVQWQDEKTLLQEQTISIILETIQNVTAMINSTPCFSDSPHIQAYMVDDSDIDSNSEEDFKKMASGDFDPEEILEHQPGSSVSPKEVIFGPTYVHEKSKHSDLGGRSKLTSILSGI